MMKYMKMVLNLNDSMISNLYFQVKFVKYDY
jgi:hypothetical protein